ncbi:MAG: ATP-binding protein [Isosphaeraceae bacterium]
MRGSAETLEALLEEARGLRQRLAHLESVEAECQRTKQELDELRRTAAEAAQARDNALHAWRESEQQYYELTEGLPQLVWMCRPDGWNIYFNQRWVEYTGRTLEESYGHGWNLAFHPDDQKRAWECWMHATECGEPFDIEYRLRRADGTYRWMLGRGLPLRDSTGRIVKWFGTCTDIGDQKETEESLRQANEKLVEAERLKGEFLANVSHELRTPLTLILAPLESLLAGEVGPFSEAVQRNLETMHNNAVRLLQMVTGLLDFSKLEAGKIEVQREPTPIVAMTRSILEDFEPLMKQKGIVGRMATALPEVVAAIDRYLYERIVFNLLSNAVKFTPEAGQVTVGLEFQGDRMHLSVSDTGIGIAEAEIPKLFKKFHQLEGSATRRFEGTGLGLALVKEFAGLLGGVVSVASTPGEGTTFRVVCQAPQVDSLPATTAPLALESLASPYGFRRGEPEAPPVSPRKLEAKVLIVEDNVELANYIASLLESICETRIGCDGEEGLELVRRWAPDLVLSDVMMPRRDGLSLCRELKSRPETATVPVILLTALTHREALLRGWEAGADEYLFKPFHPTELCTRVRTILCSTLGRRRAEAEVLELNEELEQRVRDRTARLQASERELEEVTYTISHNLRSPLRAIVGFSCILLREHDQDLTDEMKAYLHKIWHNAHRVGQLVDGLLTFCHLNRRALHVQPIDLTGLAQKVVQELDAVQREQPVEIVVADLPPCRADPDLMRQVMTHLLDNALKFTRGRQEARIDIGCLRDSGGSGQPVYFIKDNGVGFDMAYADKLFGVFQRLHRQEDYEGTGVGLALVERIIHRHGGRVWAEARPDQGAAFFFTLGRSDTDG